MRMTAAMVAAGDGDATALRAALKEGGCELEAREDEHGGRLRATMRATLSQSHPWLKTNISGSGGSDWRCGSDRWPRRPISRRL